MGKLLILKNLIKFRLVDTYNPKMRQTMRWYGPSDPVTLLDIKQSGAKGVVTALHNIPNGEVWKISEILERKKIIEESGLTWDVVESLPVHEKIKTKSENFVELIDNYKISMSNLAKCNIKTICYNFMPVLDWTRTKLNMISEDGSCALEFNFNALRAFDLFILKRENAKKEYSEADINNATDYFNSLSSSDKTKLRDNIIKGLPGGENTYNLKSLKKILNNYRKVDSIQLRKNLINFLNAVVDHAKSLNILMCIHPDDPPFPIFGLPRVVSNLDDFDHIFKNVSDINNGLTFCTGSLASIFKNDLTNIFEKFSDRIHFLHLRNVKKYENGDFFETNHLDGDVDMHDIISKILREQKKRYIKDRKDYSIPMRPDHGHQMLDDLNKPTINPGYSAIGRLKGLAELRGLELGILKNM